MTTKKMARDGNRTGQIKTFDNSNSTTTPSHFKTRGATRFRQFFAMRLSCWLCQKLCGDQFFNCDASLVIDVRGGVKFV